MDKIIKLALLGVVVYFGAKMLLPLLDMGTGGGSEAFRGMGQGGECVAAADSASREFGRGIRQFSRPPIDVVNWENVQSDLRSGLDNASSLCGCGEESCAQAREAIAVLNTLLDEYDAGFRGQAPVPLNAASDLMDVEDMLYEARQLDLRGD